LKQWLQTGKTIDWLKSDYEEAMEAMSKKLWRISEPNHYGFVGELLAGDTYSPKMVGVKYFKKTTLI
jgi:mannosyl-oligosaccharide alpha-1,2-mannosidase